jgi:hypothetical protein
VKTHTLNPAPFIALTADSAVLDAAEESMHSLVDFTPFVLSFYP